MTGCLLNDWNLQAPITGFQKQQEPQAPPRRVLIPGDPSLSNRHPA